MKKMLCVLMIFFLCWCSVGTLAETDVSTMPLEELYALRIEINNEIAARRQAEYATLEGKTIAELFPDTWIAGHIRDELGKFSTSDIVTQEELDTITQFRVNGQTVDHIQVTTLEGLQYLRCLKRLEINNQENITEIPEWVGTLVNLTFLEFRYCPIVTVPDCICNLTELRTLNFFGSDIQGLPEDIGNLINLENIDIAHTQITKLPASIYNLTLKSFDREGLDID